MTETIGVVLAGGLARRMGGGDKCLIQLKGKPLLHWITARVAPQVTRLIVNANGNPARLRDFGLPVVADSVPGFAGPLAGVLAALDWAQEWAPGIEWVASFSGDAPFVPADIVARFHAAREEEGADLVVSSSGGRTNPACGLWKVALAEELRHALVVEDMHKIDAWTARYKLATVEFPTLPIDPFFNINRPEDLTEAEALAGIHIGIGA
jgi:molybdopterin-guanine dinucleotide biosynthesis protein A